MYTLVILFYASMIAMIAMILLKRREVKTGKPNIVSRIGARTDHIFQAVFTAIRNVISYVNKHTFIALTQWIAFHILLRTRKVYVEVKHRALVNPHSKKVIDAVRGRGEVKKGGASFYLRRIASEE